KCFAENFIERNSFVGAGREVLIAVVNGDLVPFPDSFSVSVRQVRNTIGSKFCEWRRIIHHRGAIGWAGGVIVLQTESVADFVRRQLFQAREYNLLHDL